MTTYLTITVLSRQVRFCYDPETEEITDITMDIGCGRYAQIENSDITEPDEWALLERKARDAWGARRDMLACCQTGFIA